MNFIGKLLASMMMHRENEVFQAETAPTIPVPQEKYFGGVPLSELTGLAREIYHGEYCSIDQWGFLVFHSRSKRGHQHNHTQMELNDNGKLISLGGHYEGELWSIPDEFAKRANERFTFTK